ncbi:DNA-binding protein [Rhizobium phaseoli]|uniref:helix-turn-helix transcriptional regulator n=1 Tax=Rhizobium phaseoli TaxID=396 RepID=UPI000F89B5F1|nr:helix-turn-helix domain-containing protein [Rhizobium phaseoli]RUM18550.1 DNA-binding protein [Rhizobium phaseoli]
MVHVTDKYAAGGNELVPPATAAKILGVSSETLRWWRYRRERLPWVVIGGRRVMYRKADIDAFIAAGRVDPLEAANG